MINLGPLIPIIALLIPIIAILTKAKQKRLETELKLGQSNSDSADARQMRDEIRALKERIVVLERIATDTNNAVALDREIENLRVPTGRLIEQEKDNEPV